MRLNSFAAPMVFLSAAAGAMAASTPDTAIQDKSRLYAVDTGDGVRLQWHPKAWASDQVGYVVKRRLGPTGEWQALPHGVLRPAFKRERDGKSLGMDAAQAAAFDAWKASGKLRGPAVSLDEAATRPQLQRSNGVPAGDTIAMSREGRLAFIYGLGCVDNAPPAGDGLEYGLFPARENGSVAGDPVAIVRVYRPAERAAWINRSGAKFRATAERAGNLLIWRMPLKEARAMGLSSFAILRQLAGETEWTTLASEIPFHVEGDDAVWNVSDPVKADASARTYRFTPKDVFQREYAGHELAVAKQAYFAPTSANLGPRNLKLSADEHGALRVAWTQPVTAWQDYAVKKYRLRAIFEKTQLAESGAESTTLTVPAEALKEVPVMMTLEALFVDEHGSQMPIASQTTLTREQVDAVLHPKAAQP